MRKRGEIIGAGILDANSENGVSQAGSVHQKRGGQGDRLLEQSEKNGRTSREQLMSDELDSTLGCMASHPVSWHTLFK